jgi:hypothetical protein
MKKKSTLAFYNLIFQLTSLIYLRSIGAPAATLFVMGIFSPKTNPKGIIAGTIASQSLLVIKIIGMVYFPEPPSHQNLTVRTTTTCLNQTLSEPITVEIDFQEPSEVWWHRIFWISKVGWNGFLAMVAFAITCML